MSRPDHLRPGLESLARLEAPAADPARLEASIAAAQAALLAAASPGSPARPSGWHWLGTRMNAFAGGAGAVVAATLIGILVVPELFSPTPGIPAPGTPEAMRLPGPAAREPAPAAEIAIAPPPPEPAPAPLAMRRVAPASAPTSAPPAAPMPQMAAPAPETADAPASMMARSPGSDTRNSTGTGLAADSLAGAAPGFELDGLNFTRQPGLALLEEGRRIAVFSELPAPPDTAALIAPDLLLLAREGLWEVLRRGPDGFTPDADLTLQLRNAPGAPLSRDAAVTLIGE